MMSPVASLARSLEKVGEVVLAWIAVSKIKSFTDGELIRFSRSVMFCDEKMEQTLLGHLRFHHSQRRMGEVEMVELAKLLANGDVILEEVLLWNMHFYGGRAPSAPTKRKGIYFWMVGRNASHQFEAGMKNGKRYRYSFGEGDDFRKVGAYIKEVPDWAGYYGHF